MTHNLFTATVLCFLLVASTYASSTELERNGATGVRFTENRGQIVDSDGRVRNDIRFTAECGGVRLYFSDRGVSYVFAKTAAVAERPNDAGNAFAKAGPGSVFPPGMDADALRSNVTQLHRVQMELLGGAPFPRIRFEDELPGYTNYYYPHCPDGITHVKSYATAVYEDVYPSIDLVFMTVNGRVKYEYRVRPGGNPADIRMRYNGASDMALLPGGILAVHSPLGWMEEAQPYSFQDAGREVRSAYRLRVDELSFEIGQYDGTRTLVIDPWSTFFGGNGAEMATDVATDANGNIHISGWTSSTVFPTTTGAFQPSLAGIRDAFAAKFTSNGILLWATYYGGSGFDTEGVDPLICLDATGDVYLAGTTESADLPVTAGAFQTTFGGDYDGFVVKFNSSGTRQWATFLGGNDYDGIVSIDAHEITGLCVTGYAHSRNFPTTAGAYQPSISKAPDAIITRFNASGGVLWSTYVGGRGSDGGESIVIDGSGDVIITGRTASDNFPVTSGAFQSTRAGGTDGFLTKFSSTGGRLWATYVGGSMTDVPRAVVAGQTGEITIAGFTSSTNYPVTVSAFQTTYGGGMCDCMLSRFDANGGLLWSSYYGGNGFDAAEGLATNGNGDLVLVGGTYSTDLPVTVGAMQSTFAGVHDGLVSRFTAAGAQVWGTYIGRSQEENFHGVTMDASGNSIVVGYTSSTDFPILNAWQSSLNGTGDAIIMQLDANGQLPIPYQAPVAVASAQPTSGDAPLTVQFTGSNSSDPLGSNTTYTWDFGDGGSDQTCCPSHIYLNPGNYTAMLTVTDQMSATSTDNVAITVTAATTHVMRVISQTVTRVLVQSKADRWEGRDLVTVRDANNIPVSGAVVTANYSGPNSGMTSGTTNSSGEAVLATESQKSPSGVWCFDITGVQASGYTYDASTSITQACETTTPKSVASVPAIPVLNVSPNPFSVRTVMTVSLPTATDLTLIVYDALGREVGTLAQGSYPHGAFIAEFDASGLARGTYYVRLYAGRTVLTRMLLVE